MFLGVNTFGWSYVVNKKVVPENMPYLLLTAPSGDLWEFGDKNNEEIISGEAVSFAQVVTQTRSFYDVNLKVKGQVAAEWMNIAQCFAGSLEKPPLAGTRFIQ